MLLLAYPSESATSMSANPFDQALEPLHVHRAIKAAYEHLNRLVQPVMNGEDGAVTGIEYIAFQERRYRFAVR